MRSPGLWMTVAALTALPMGNAAAQELWPGRTPANFRFDLGRPSFDDADLGFFTVTMTPMFRFKVSSLNIVADLPLASYAGEGETDEGDFRVGNPYIGLESAKPGSAWTLQLGGRIPISDYGDDGSALLVGTLSDWDHVEAWIPDLVPITATAVFEQVSEGGLALGARLGGSGFFYTGDDDADPDLLVNYGARLGYEKDGAVLGAMFTGRWIATSDDDDNVQNQLAFEVGYRVGSVMPMIALRLPLDAPLKEDLNTVLTLTLKAWW